VSANHCVCSVEDASPVVRRVPESNSPAPSENNSQRNSPGLETANELKCLKNCRYLSNSPRLFERLIRDQSGGLYTDSRKLPVCVDYSGSKTVQRNVE
jgi:hypothetical protein